MVTHVPTTWLGAHLRWTRSGVVWATWRIAPLPYGRRPVKEKKAVRSLHRLLFRSLDGEALLLGHAVGLDPVAVVERQIEGIRLSDCPDLALEAEANLDRLSELVLGERAHYLCVPLSNVGSRRWTAPSKAALGAVHEALGVPRVRPSQEEVNHRLEQAAQIEALIPFQFGARPVTVAEQLWMDAHACRRGMVDMPPPVAGSVEEELLMSSSASLPQPILDEGAWSDPEVGEVTLRNPLERRVLKVVDPRGAELGQPASYQCPLVLTDTPPAGVLWPGSELFERVDDLAQDVDWAIRLKVVAREDVMAANRRALRDLNDQYEQRSDELSTGVTDLDLAAELLAEYQSIFAEDRLEVEVAHVIVLTVPGATAEDAMERATGLTAQLASADFTVQRPLGALGDLWCLSQPGWPAGQAMRAWALHTTSAKMSALVPFTTTRLGGRTGPVWGLNESTARTSVIHLAPGGYPELNKSGSVAFIAELGAGKSVGLKAMCNAIVDELGQVMAIDKSADGEWAYYARSLTDPVIVDPEALEWSMDPLRIFPGADGGEVALSLLTQLFGLSPSEDDGATLADVLDLEYRSGHALQGCQDVMEHLISGSCELPAAQEVGKRMQRVARSRLGRLVFDQALPAVPADADAIVWRTHRMSQPTEQEIATAHLFRQLPPEKVFGRAYYSLLTATARRFAFADRTRVSALVCDEAYDIFANPYNALDLEHFGRQGRRPKALLLLGSHDPDHDFGSETLRALVPTRVVLRQTDPGLAKASVRYLGVSEDDPEFALMVEELIGDISPISEYTDPESGERVEGVPPERRGECFLRDAFGGIGRARVLIPARSDRAKACLTTPPKARTSQ